jgi:hypothetical protein
MPLRRRHAPPKPTNPRKDHGRVVAAVVAAGGAVGLSAGRIRNEMQRHCPAKPSRVKSARLAAAGAVVKEGAARKKLRSRTLWRKRNRKVK